MSRMSLDTAIRLSAEVKGGGNIDRVKRSLQDLGKGGQTTRMDMVRLEVATKNYARANGNTLAGIRSSIGAFRGLQEQAKIGSREFQRYGAEVQKLEAKLRGLDSTAEKVGASLGQKLAAGLAASLATIGAGRAIGGSLTAVVASEESERRLRLLSQGLDDYSRVQAAATAAADKFGVAQTQANQEFAQIYARLRPIGLTLEEISTVYNGFNTAAKLSGTTSTEASAAFLQLSQALGTGVLRGEELNSVFEQTPAVVQGIAQVMGVPIGQIRDLAKEGKITGDIVLEALRRIEIDGAPKLAEAMKGPAQQFKNLQIAGQELQIQLGEALLPTAILLAQAATRLLQEFNKLPEPIKNVGLVATVAAVGIASLATAISAIGGITAATTALKAYAGAATAAGTASAVATGKAAALLGVMTKLGKLGLIVIGVKFAIEGLDELITGLVGVRDAEAAGRAMAERRGLTYVPSAAVERRQQPTSWQQSMFGGRGRGAMPTPGSGTAPNAIGTPIGSMVTAGPGAGGGSGGSGGSSQAAAESIGAQIAKSLQQALSLTPAQSAGVVGNLMRESGLNPRINEGGAVGLPRGVGGYGLAQWTGSRQTDLVRFAGGGAAAGDIQTQLRFMVSELLGPESRALASLRRTTTPEEAAVVFDRDYERSGIKALGERKANARQVFNEISGTGPGAGLGDFASQLQAQAQAAEQLQQQQQAATADLEKFVEARTESVTKLNQESELLRVTTDYDRRRLEYAFEQNDINDRHNQIKRDFETLSQRLLELGIEYNAEQQLARIEAERQQALANARVKAEQEINDIMAERTRMMQGITQQAAAPTAFNELEQQNAQLQEMLEKYPAIGQAADAAADLATRGMAEMIAGTKSAKDVFVDFLNDIANALIDTAKRMIAQYIAIGIAKAFAGLGGAGGGDFAPSSAGPFGGDGLSTGLSFDPSGFGRALGGSTATGRPYKVGENGPELFVPYQAGTIIPAEATEALEAINNASLRGLQVPFQATAATASGKASQQGSSSSSSGLSVPFQRGMEGLSVPFQRGGMDGSAAAGGGGSGWDSPIRFESVLVNSEELVTRKQAEEIGRRSEQRGAALALKRYKNNPTDRRGAGLP